MTTFGEIVEPSSRSVWEDWDETNTNDYQNTSRLQWQADIKYEENIEIFLILEGKYFGDFNNTQGDTKMDLVNLVPELGLKLYKMTEENCLICVIKEYNLIQSSEIVELLKNFVSKSNNVITVFTKPLFEFQSEISTQGCVVRSLSTSKPVSGICSKIKFPKLEQPNMISGVTAGVVWLREILGLSALAIVFYMETAEEEQVQQLQLLLQNLNIATLKTRPLQILSSNLYI